MYHTSQTNAKEIEGSTFEQRKLSSTPEQLRELATYLLEQDVEEVVIESTAQYWKPVWESIERYWEPLCEKREGARSAVNATGRFVAQNCGIR